MLRKGLTLGLPEPTVSNPARKTMKVCLEKVGEKKQNHRDDRRVDKYAAKEPIECHSCVSFQGQVVLTVADRRSQPPLGPGRQPVV